MMKEPKELPGKTTPAVEDPNTKKSSPGAPVIETPVPPQVMDPSAPNDAEKNKPSTSPDKRKKKPSKTSRKT